MYLIYFMLSTGHKTLNKKSSSLLFNCCNLKKQNNQVISFTIIKTMDPKAFIVPVLLLISIGVTIASIATPFAEIGVYTYGLLVYCANGVCDSYASGCTDFGALRAADVALEIISIIVLFIGLICALVRLCVASCQVAGNCAGKTVAVVAIMAAVLLLAAWAIGFALFSGTFCGLTVKDYAGAKIGAHAPVGIVAWAFTIGTAVAEFVINKPFSAAAEAPAAAAPAAQ